MYPLDELKNLTGSPKDDTENSFTARMLMMLESEPVLHDEAYRVHLESIITHYYRDSHGKRSFRPLFLLNDVLRYWRTLCLNYEERKHDRTKPWRKKNVNLKFSRMVTVFSLVLPLVLVPGVDASAVLKLCRKTPLERLADGLDVLNDGRLSAQWPSVLGLYEDFLCWKEDEDVEHHLETGKNPELVRKHAETLSIFLNAALTHDRIPAELRRYLVL